MKTLSELIHATEARAAQTVITPARGSPKLEDCLMVYAIPGTDTNVQLTAILVGADNTVSDEAFDHYLADLDDPKTWLSSGVEPPRRMTDRKA